jgi:two-component system, OmpR family, response regulator
MTIKEVKVRVLLAEDDENLGSLLQEYLQARNIEADWVMNGEKAFRLFEKNHYDLCILDVMMPVKDGFTLATEIHIVDSGMPIIFLTAKSMKEDILEGFSLGADDYITKPFSMEELIFRIEAILRRTKSTGEGKNNIQNIGIYEFDPQKQTLSYKNQIQNLTTKETDLLKLLCNNKNRVLERNFALKAIWIDDNYFNARSMDVYITKLRKYLKDDSSVQIINVHGKGFKLIVENK